MIKLTNLVMPLQYTHAQLLQKISNQLKVPVNDILQVEYLRKALDARKKPIIRIILTLAIRVADEKSVLNKHAKDKDVQEYIPYVYTVPPCKSAKTRPVIIGFGPAGMFAAYILAKAGLNPIVLEQGKSVEERQKDVAIFRETGKLCPHSNIQFGEGGAGTFSDGKLTTGIKDHRIRFVLQTFVACGAPEGILYLAKPHIGTDLLVKVVRNLRKRIQALGGEIFFESTVTGFTQTNGHISSVCYMKDGKKCVLETSQCILAIGHSSRELFEWLYQNHVSMIQKNFAMGMRIEHPQAWLDRKMYGEQKAALNLPQADYKLVAHLPNGRSLYTFCMCPGGEVVAAASEENRLVVNGMSNYKRDGNNANSALLVAITSKELHDNHPLAGMWFQRKTEEAAFLAGGGNYFAPTCCLGDFLADHSAAGSGSVLPTYRPGVNWVSPNEYLPQFMVQTLKNGILAMDSKIHGFAMSDAVLTGVESRSSSPVRILRNEKCESISLAGLYPCGEGAGYAGGITSAAVDGIRCAEYLIQAL